MISIIVPCHNSENYIANTINSVIKQSDERWELIIVDDKSTDNSISIIKEYTAKDNRIKLFQSNKNFGVAASRNKGINESSGDILTFLDSDDTIEPDYIETINKNWELYNPDILYFQYNIIQDGNVKPVDNKIVKNEIIEKKDALQLLFLDIPDLNSMCNKAFKRSFIIDNNIRLNERRMHGEDMEFIMQSFKAGAKIVCIENHLYNYIRQNTNSITNSFRESDWPLMLETITLYRTMASENGINPIKGFYAKHLKSILEQIYLAAKQNPEIAKEMIFKVRNSDPYRFALKDSKYGNLPKTYRILSQLMEVSPFLAIKFARLK